MSEVARLELDGTVYELPTFVGSEGERAIDISKLRDTTGYITLDDGYGNTGSCRSAITYIDGDAGILRYRGIPIEDLAGRSSFVETAWLVIYALTTGIDTPGYASTMVAVLMLGGLNLLSLGLIGEYLGRVAIEVRGRPLFIVESTKGF